MTMYIALLRGINVSGHRIIKMTELKRMFESMGLDRVHTYIQSGNVLFDSEIAAESLRGQIELKIMAAFGFPVTVVLRTMAELERVIQNCPFDAHRLSEGEHLYVTLLDETPSQERIDRLLASSSETDDCRIVNREVYVLYRQSVHKSTFSNNFFERKLGVAATSRNWQTITKLVAMGNEIERH